MPPSSNCAATRSCNRSPGPVSGTMIREALSRLIRLGAACGSDSAWAALFISQTIRCANRMRASGFAQGRVNYLRFDRDGALWAATSGGLSRLKDSRVITLTSSNGLPCETVHWMIEDNSGSFWLDTACGLVRITRNELDKWVDAVEKDQGSQATDPVRSLR